MSELRAGLADARRTPGARPLDGRRWGTFGYALGYALGALKQRSAELVMIVPMIALAVYITHALSAGPQVIINPAPPQQHCWTATTPDTLC